MIIILITSTPPQCFVLISFLMLCLQNYIVHLNIKCIPLGPWYCVCLNKFEVTNQDHLFFKVEVANMA